MEQVFDKDNPQEAPRQAMQNLIAYVSGRLAESGHPNPQAWEIGLHEDAYTTQDFSIHRFLVNRQLRLLIGAIPENTTQIRFCLVESGKPEDWMRLFEEMVLPCMMKHSVPQMEYAEVSAH